ncbi:hypothetical protein [Cohnella silvisoli]|uniref:Uncharacterized protein n=1 Tax=Cohnella silvisoli TaxID=2873699 RepID=A0ABV1KSA2_9BACL|nr:hypothetical protein [Cohnella silvisoli]MCD9022548.1 hypothetical protein [Cohnella silvisoli]
MRISIIITVFIILTLQLTACNKNKNIPTSDIVKKSIVDTDEIKIVYGDGNELTMNDGVTVGRVKSLLKAMNYEEVDLPDTVGQNFTLKLSRERELYYISSGYLKINETLYKASNADIVTELDDFVVNYGLQEIPDLLGKK